MDCRQAAELISASADGELLDAQQLALARQHCLECAECRQLSRLIERTSAVRPPAAPEHLLTRLDTVAAGAARHLREAEDEAASLAEEMTRPAPLEERRRHRWTWVTTFASAAAVLLVALTMGGIMMLSKTPSATEGSAVTMSKDNGAASTAPLAGDAERDFAAQEAATLAPSYVVYGDTVWVLVGPVEEPSGVPSGTVTSDLGSGTSSYHDAFLSADGRELVVRADDGSYLGFTRVVRTKEHVSYRMVTDVAVELFGQWPTLPNAIPTPEDADGSPVFDRFSLDDLDVDVYTLRSGGLEDGFAIAPGTTAGDPAAGNPNWTWWEKAE